MNQLIQLKSLPNVALVRLPELNGELELYYGSPTMDRSEPIYLVEHVHGAGKKFLVKIGVVKDGNWRIVSMLSEISEEWCKGIVGHDDEYGVTMYQNYITTSSLYYDEQITAIESFHSAIRSGGIVVCGCDQDTVSFCGNDCLDRIDGVGSNGIDPEHTLVIEKLLAK